VSGLLFTGERLHADDPLFAIDLVRHRAAYAFAISLAGSETHGCILDLGCGTGYGTRELADALPRVFAVDRIAPDAGARHPRCSFIRADAAHIPLQNAAFDMVVSFQVVEHLDDPGPYLQALARLLRPGGVALLSTPNRLESDGENPFHVREYEADDFAALLGHYFGAVEMLGVSATPGPKAYYDARLRRIRAIVRLDPLRLRHRLPRRLVDRLFAILAVVVRKAIQRGEGLPPADLEDFPIRAAEPHCLDLLAVCRLPRAASNREGDAP
jgi:SAM-dependent methyltransferase